MPRVPPSTVSINNLPSGIDRADGLGGRLGTATTGLSVQTPGGGTSIEQIPINELPDSPYIERAEQGTASHKYSMSYTEALTRLSVFGRGTLVVDSGANYWRVLSSSVQYIRGDHSILTINLESVSFDVPPDEFSTTPARLNIDLLKHPRYFYALMPTNQIPQPWPSWLVADNDDQIAVKQAIIRSIQAYRDTPWAPAASTIATLAGNYHERFGVSFVDGKIVFAKANPNFVVSINETSPPKVGQTFPDNSNLPYPKVATAVGQANPRFYYSYYSSSSSDPGGKVGLACAAAQEIIGKLWLMEDSPMVHGIEISWTSYYWRPPYLNLGSYIENPLSIIPDYFYSVTFPPDANYTVFDYLGYWAPQIYSQNGFSGGGVNISWLRDADTVEYQRTWYRVTRKWLGAPIGVWDAQLYSSSNRPNTPSQYVPMVF